MSRLVVLVADSNMKAAVEGLLTRSESLRIRCGDYQVHPHPGHDPGVWNDAVEFLRVVAQPDDHVLVVLDREGSGHEDQSADQMENTLQASLVRAGRGGRSGAVVIDPELEIWVWSDSPHVGQILGMDGQAFQRVLATEMMPNGKPARPRELMESILRRTRVPRSSSLYGKLARTVGIGRCTDRAFLRLRDFLQQWFPA